MTRLQSADELWSPRAVWTDMLGWPLSGLAHRTDSTLDTALDQDLVCWGDEPPGPVPYRIGERDM